MSRLTFELESSVEPGRMVAAATDFSERRPDWWPYLSRDFYQVERVGEASAEAREGTEHTLGATWVLSHYEWSDKTVRAVIRDSNLFRPGGTWEMSVLPRDGGGSRVQVTAESRFKGVLGPVLDLVVPPLGRSYFRNRFKKTVAILEREAGDSSSA